MSDDAMTIRLAGPGVHGGLAGGTIAAILLTLFAVDNLLVLGFLGAPPLLVAALITVAVGAVALFSSKVLAAMPRVPYSALAGAIGIAAVLLILGGEGRFVYATPDWQVRDAILADLARLPWPFAYAADDQAYFLRAPIGMYILPSLAGAGRAAEYALLGSNAIRFGLVLALAWPLFNSARARGIALAVFLLFSGWDIIGAALSSALGIEVNWGNLESWNHGFQFSSHVTQLFWVPNHTLPGWACAVTFLLWRCGQAPVGLFAATVPLVVIWSPLAVIGAMPFVVFAGMVVLRHRTVRPGDVVLAVLAVVIAAGAVLYLQLDADKVGAAIRREGRATTFILCALLEVLPFIVPLLWDRRSPGRDGPVLWLILAVLVILPALRIGQHADLQMRGSIMPLALLAIAFAGWTTRLIETRPRRKAALGFALTALAIGAVTPAFELRRIFIYPTSPEPLCSFVDVWPKQTGVVVPWTTYLARVEALPSALPTFPIVAVASGDELQECWETPWPGQRYR